MRQDIELWTCETCKKTFTDEGKYNTHMYEHDLVYVALPRESIASLIYTLEAAFQMGINVDKLAFAELKKYKRRKI